MRIEHPRTNEELKKLVDIALSKDNCADLNFIDVSWITDFSYIFSGRYFKGDISKWNVSNGRNFASMFNMCNFNGDISDWDMSNATMTGYMFCNSQFNGDISDWNMERVVSANGMFINSKFNGDISKWKFKSLQSYKDMFKYTENEVMYNRVMEVKATFMLARFEMAMVANA